MTQTSPQHELERLVQDRASHLVADTNAETVEHELRHLVADEVDRWNDEHRRGTRTQPLEPVDSVVERAVRNLTGFGPLSALLEDDDVWEIMINAPDLVFVRRQKGRSGYHPEVFHDDDHVTRTVTRLLERSSTSHRKLDPAEGLQDAQLDDGARVHIVHGDISRGGHLIVNIRKFTGVTYRTLDELVGRGTLDRPAASLLSAAVRSDCTIVFAGAPGSGKTTLLSCCAAELVPTRRVVIAEEVFEADVPLPNVASLQTRPARTDRPEVDLRRLVTGFLRMAPDVAIVGEVRDREALPLLLTLSSGVTGFTTIHAGSARQALTRLRFICQLAGEDLPVGALNQLVSESIDLVVHATRGPDGPFVDEIVAVEDLLAGPDGTQFTTTSLFERTSPVEPLCWTGNLPVRLSSRLRRAGFDPRALFAAQESEPTAVARPR